MATARSSLHPITVEAVHFSERMVVGLFCSLNAGEGRDQLNQAGVREVKIGQQGINHLKGRASGYR